MLLYKAGRGTEPSCFYRVQSFTDSDATSLPTNRAVLALVQKLNYQPNPPASGLCRQKRPTIAMVLPEIANNFYPCY